MINPIDFAALYREKREDLLKQAEAAKLHENAPTVN
jgi:hypothetical protein